VLTLRALGYHARIVRTEQLVLPAALWALFALMLGVFAGEGARRLDTVVAYLAMVLPMTAGVLAAGAVVDDPVLELHLVAPRPAWRLLVERLALVLAIATVGAVSFQVLASVLGVSLAGLGGILPRQLAWLVPSLALCCLSSAASLGVRHSMGGALLVGFVWLVQVMIREGISATAWGRYLYLFMGARQPGHPALVANQLTLVGLASALAVAGGLMLRRGERYL
jgi:hypothetical protein